MLVQRMPCGAGQGRANTLKRCLSVFTAVQLPGLGLDLSWCSCRTVWCGERDKSDQFSFCLPVPMLCLQPPGHPRRGFWRERVPAFLVFFLAKRKEVSWDWAEQRGLVEMGKEGENCDSHSALVSMGCTQLYPVWHVDGKAPPGWAWMPVGKEATKGRGESFE